jgi:hypothetical protein
MRSWRVANPLILNTSALSSRCRNLTIAALQTARQTIGDGHLPLRSQGFGFFTLMDKGQATRARLCKRDCAPASIGRPVRRIVTLVTLIREDMSLLKCFALQDEHKQ